MVLVGFAAGGGGATALWAYATQRDASGFFTTSTESFTSPGYALTSTVDLGTQPGSSGWIPIHSYGTVRIRAALADGSAVFVGIAPQSAIDGYLGRVAHDEVANVSFLPFRASYRHSGGGAPASPLVQHFWSSHVSGTGTRTLTWEAEPGRWGLVVMRADARHPVVAAVSVGAKGGWVLPVGIGLAAGGLLVFLGGALLVARLARRRREAYQGAAATTAPAGIPGGPPVSARASYPLRIEARLDEPLSRWLWLVKWFLAIPHYIALAFLWMAFGVLTLFAGVAILVTGRYPRGIFEFNVGVLRWTWRVSYYSYGALGTDRYPPFSLEPDPDYPADLTVEYPERLSRGLVLIKWWLLALPQYLIVGLLAGGWSLLPWQHSGGFLPLLGGGLIGLLVLVAGVVVAVGGRYPEPLFDVVIGLNRWVYRVVAYAGLMRDEYPPFRLDSGGEDPSGAPAGPADQQRLADELPGAA